MLGPMIRAHIRGLLAVMVCVVHYAFNGIATVMMLLDR